MTFKMPEEFVVHTISDMEPRNIQWIDPHDVEILSDGMVAVHKNAPVTNKPTSRSTVEVYKNTLGGIELDVSNLYTIEPDYLFEKSYCESEPLIFVSNVIGLPL